MDKGVVHRVVTVWGHAKSTSTDLSPDVESALADACKREKKGSAAEGALRTILENVRMSRETGRPICQDTGTPVFVHMDGDLKPLWRDIGSSGVRGLDSMSPPPDNDTSVAQALEMWPEMRLCINFPSSLHLKPPEEIRAAALEILEQGGRSNRLQIQISENLPPGRWQVSRRGA